MMKRYMVFWKDRWKGLPKGLKISLALLFCLPVTATVSLWIFLVCYHRRDYLPQFRERASPASVRLIGEKRTLMGTRRDIHVKTEGGIEFHAAVRIPEGDGPFPATVCLGGFLTGRNAVDKVPPCDMVIASLDYPYHGPRKLNARQWISRLLEMRRAALDTPPAAIALLDYLERLPVVDPDKTAIFGASLGGPFSLAAGAAEERFEAVVIGYACGNLRAWGLANSQDIPRGLRGLTAWFVAEIVHPLEPLRYVNRISPRPLLAIAGREDPHVPETEVVRLYDCAGEPKDLLWLGGSHLTPENADLVEELAREALRWISDQFRNSTNGVIGD